MTGFRHRFQDALRPVLAGWRRLRNIDGRMGANSTSCCPPVTVAIGNRASVLLGFQSVRRQSGSLSFGSFLLCLATHADEFVDKVIDGFALLCLATHPN